MPENRNIVQTVSWKRGSAKTRNFPIQIGETMKPSGFIVSPFLPSDFCVSALSRLRDLPCSWFLRSRHQSPPAALCHPAPLTPPPARSLTARLSCETCFGLRDLPSRTIFESPRAGRSCVRLEFVRRPARRVALIPPPFPPVSPLFLVLFLFLFLTRLRRFLR